MPLSSDSTLTNILHINSESHLSLISSDFNRISTVLSLKLCFFLKYSPFTLIT